MTKVQTEFQLQRPLDETAMSRIADAYSIYGIQKIRIDPAANKLIVEYDATRLQPAEVYSALANAGIPVLPK